MHSTAPVLEIQRSAGSSFEGDDSRGAFELLADGARHGLPGALITIVGIEGRAPRALGSHMAVLIDGTYCGYVSGGCVEAAIAGEALNTLRSGNDAVLRFGCGSPFMDIRLPCGGGIDLHVHVNPAPEMIVKALDAFSQRKAFTLAFSPTNGTAIIVADTNTQAASAWDNDLFLRRYKPKTKLVLIGRGLEFETLCQTSHAAGFELAVFSPDAHGMQMAQSLGASVTRLVGLSDAPSLPIDPWTAVVFLFHDHDWETNLLMQAINREAFFVGALGSHTTHAARCARLRERGVTEEALNRIKGPIGLFGPTRDAASTAVSALAQIIEERRTLDGL